MLITLSPAKTLDFDSSLKTTRFSQPDFLERSERLISTLRRQSSPTLQKLMKISPALAELNRDRYRDWHPEFDLTNARQAILAFKGDVYVGLDVDTMKVNDLVWAQKHLRILSGLYGALRPLDLIQPYRLEMGTNLPSGRNKNLYEFWGSEITRALNVQLQQIKSETVLNLASNEYFKSVKKKELDATIVSPVFKDWKNGQYKLISFFAKKARGSMSAWVIKNRITDVERLQEFSEDGYHYDPASSTQDKPTFLRKQA